MITFTNARVFDGVNNTLHQVNVNVESERIHSVSDAPPAPDSEIIDCGGRVLMPGLIDAHVHVYAYDLNVHRLQGMPLTMLAHHAANMLRDCLDRGFTAVRDTAGADWGLWMAIERGLITAPRLYYCGRALTVEGLDVDGAIAVLRSIGVHDFFASFLPQGSFAPGTNQALIARALEAASEGRELGTVVAVILTAVSSDTTALAKAVSVPALVVTGELDMTCPVSSGLAVAAALRTELIALPGRGHVVSMEAPEEVAALIEQHAVAHDFP